MLICVPGGAVLHSPGGAAPDVAAIQMRIAEMEQELARGPSQEHALVVPNPRHAAQLQERIAWARQACAGGAAAVGGGGGMGMVAPDGTALASHATNTSLLARCSAFILRSL